MTRRSLLDIFVDALFRLYSVPIVQRISRPLIDVLYRAYERFLYNQVVRCGIIPRHVAIIPDGNRRWARRRGFEVWKGHEHGYERIKQVLEWLYEIGVKVVTVYALSYENCMRRPKEELEKLFELARKGLRELIEGEIVDRYRVRVKVIGRLALVPPDIRELAKKLEEKTQHYNERFLNIAICYGGRQDIVDAVRKIVRDVLEGRMKLEEISEESIVKALSTGHLGSDGDPDLVIRTSGEMRISNFLLWQIAYSELYFCDVYWPEFRKIDLLRAIRSYQRRERRFGR